MLDEDLPDEDDDALLDEVPLVDEALPEVVAPLVDEAPLDAAVPAGSFLSEPVRVVSVLAVPAVSFPAPPRESVR